MSVKKQFASFEEMLKASETPLLVDFYAPWCGPCQMMGPVLEEVSKQMQGKVKVVKINTDNYPQLASKYQIQALPTLVLFKGGEPVQRFEGGVQAPQLISSLQSYV
jgi:thioredoxin